MYDEHLRQHLRDGKHLRELALQEFVAAARSGRLIAFVGSYATEDLGYPEWKEFLGKYAEKFDTRQTSCSSLITLAKDRISGSAPLPPDPHTVSSKTALIDLIIEHWKANPRKWAKRSKESSETDLEGFRTELCESDFFGLRSKQALVDSSPHQIIESLGITRIITTNYDLEFEWQLMLTREEHRAAGLRPAAAFDRLLQDGKIARNRDAGALSRRLPSGRTTYSDVFDRGRADRLIEFAVGAPDHHGHVLHLHGRATVGDHNKLIVGLGDYEQQYRRSGIAKVPFEHALKLLYGGNPVIFIGNGMSEPEVTNTLENFVSDSLRNRLAPAFVLWSPNVLATDPREIKLDAHDELRRIEWYRRFGVFTIYDCDLGRSFNPRLAVNDCDAKSRPRRVLHAVKALGNYGKKLIQGFRWEREHLRSAQTRYSCPGAPAGADELRFDVWPCEPLIKNEDEMLNILRAGPSARVLADAADFDDFKMLFRGAPVKAIIDHPGAGHGYLAKVIAKAFSSPETLKKVGVDVAASLVNAGFVCEIDSTFALISGLFDGNTATGSQPPKSRQAALLEYGEKLEKQMDGLQLDRHLLLVINGMDRFFDTSGYPLSNELDNMIRKIAQTYRRTYKIHNTPGSIHEWVQGCNTINPYTVVLLGTPRVQRYLEGLDWIAQTAETADRPFPGDYAIISSRGAGMGRDVLDKIYERNDRLWDARKARGEEDLRGLFAREEGQPHSNYLEIVQHRMGVPPSLAREARIARARARSVGDLRHGILEAFLRSGSIGAALKKRGLDESLADLCLDLLSNLSFFGQPIDRCVFDQLPRVKQAFPSARMRKDKVETAVNALLDLGLMLAFPAFPDTPPDALRYGLHRTVMAELRNHYGVPISEAKLSAGFNLSLFASQLIDDYTPEQDIHCDLGDVVDSLIAACKLFISEGHAGWVEPGAYLRAAMLLMRNYFTTSALLMLEPPADISDEFKAPMSQHAERLEGLIKAGEMLASARKRSKNAQGAEAFFPDDLVWLHNELGVVKLVQGDLYKARFAFEAAEAINREHVEYQDRLQNWQRIQLNQLQLDIERGKISRAENRILDIERAVNDHVDGFQLGAPPAFPPGARVAAAPAPAQERTAFAVDRIITRYGKGPHERTRVVDPDFPADAILTVGLLTGYRGLCGYLRGNFKSAEHEFKLAVEILRNIGEQRACAIFVRHSASLQHSMGAHEPARDLRKIGLAAADSVRQMDVAFLYRVDGVSADASDPARAQSAAQLRQIMAALHYAVGSDVYRVRIEARIAFADIRMAAGDYDAALEHAADALAVAARFGFSLRKISLRIMIGRILIRRGDPASGNALLNQAIVNADRVGYQRAVELAQRVRYEDSQLY